MNRDNLTTGKSAGAGIAVEHIQRPQLEHPQPPVVRGGKLLCWKCHTILNQHHRGRCPGCRAEIVTEPRP